MKFGFKIIWVLLWLALLVIPTAHSIRTADTRFSRDMYPQQINYQITYFWLVSENQFEAYRVPANELSPQGMELLSPDIEHDLAYGFGSLKTLVNDYMWYISTKDTIYRPRVSIGVGWGLDYSINGGEEQYLALQHLDE